MEFIKFKIQEKHSIVNNKCEKKFFYFTDKINNNNNYLLITINHSNIELFRIIVNNKVKFISGNISRNHIEIKPHEEYYYEIFDKTGKYINKIDLKKKYILVYLYKNTLPYHIKSNMKILFFDIRNFVLYTGCFTFSISTNEFMLNSNKKVNVQNFNLDNSIFTKFIKNYKYKNYYSKLEKLFIIDNLSLVKNNIILNYKINNVHNFEYYNKDDLNIIYKIYLTNHEQQILIKINYDIFDKENDSYKYVENFYEHFEKDILKNYKKTNYIVIDIDENSDEEYVNEVKSKIINKNDNEKYIEYFNELFIKSEENQKNINDLSEITDKNFKILINMQHDIVKMINNKNNKNTNEINIEILYNNNSETSKEYTETNYYNIFIINIIKKILLILLSFIFIIFYIVVLSLIQIVYIII